MDLMRRDFLRTSMMAGLATGIPAHLSGSPVNLTGVIDTTGGKLRGSREGPVSAFRGIPYGADTGSRRFLAPVAAPPWSGVRDCLDFGHRAPQGVTGPGQMPPGASMARVGIMADAFKQGQVASGNESQDCLFLNVYTPDASPRGKRPVLFWLHGGGFRIGSANEPVYEGGVLAARGDVVVVTINHRLYSPGYLYLGELHSDFADSGNAGQLDQVLALRWVRDNIAQFGGDPDNVTIFGQSGGGHKVSCLLNMPAANGLFHKAIVQSGAGLKMVSRDDATSFSRSLLGTLNLTPADVHKLQSLPLTDLLRACSEADRMTSPGKRTMSPVVDGSILPADPFDPHSPSLSRDVPVIVGSTKDEATMFSMGDPKFGTMTFDDAQGRFNQTKHDKGDAAFAFYRRQRPNEAPTYLVTSMLTESGMWLDSIRLAERKHALGAAKVFMYRIDWEPPVFDGVLRSTHGIDTPMVFGHPHEFARILGTGPEPLHISGQLMDAWIAFAHSGNPSTRSMPWPAYEPVKRQTMIFAGRSHVASDPDNAIREFWSA